jgi:hypothetical protein
MRKISMLQSYGLVPTADLTAKCMAVGMSKQKIALHHSSDWLQNFVKL